MKDVFISAFKRVGYALPFAILCGYSVHKAFHGAGVPEAMAWLLYAAAGLIVIATIFAFPVAGFIGEQLGRFFFPGGSEVPPPNYRLAARYEQEAKWDLALAEFEKIIYYHPGELPAHVGRIRLALLGYQDDATARRLFKSSQRTLRSSDSLPLLQEAWDTLHAHGCP